MLSKVLILMIAVFAFVIIYAFIEGQGRVSREGYVASYVSSPRHETSKWSDMHALSYPTKCVSCEHVFPEGERWRAQNTKCFSCERLAEAHQRRLIHPQDTHPNKIFI